MTKRECIVCCVILMLILISGLGLSQTVSDDKTDALNKQSAEPLEGQKPLANNKNSTYILTSHTPNRSTSAVTLYDFTVVDSIYGGSSGAVELEPGVWGMIAGDVNESGHISASDRIAVWEANDFGYLTEDINLSGHISAADRIMIETANGFSAVP